MVATGASFETLEVRASGAPNQVKPGPVASEPGPASADTKHNHEPPVHDSGFDILQDNDWKSIWKPNASKSCSLSDAIHMLT